MSERKDLALLSLAETAELLGVSKSTIRRAVDRGDLEAVRLSSKLVRIRAASVERWIAESSGMARAS